MKLRTIQGTVPGEKAERVDDSATKPSKVLPGYPTEPIDHASIGATKEWLAKGLFAKGEHNSITSRRRFLAVSGAASVASVGTLAAAAMPPAAFPACTQDDSALLKLEEQYFEQKELADSYDDEIWRLSDIWTAESERLYQESLRAEIQAGKYLTPEERWDIVTKTPECVEHSRLPAERLQPVCLVTRKSSHRRLAGRAVDRTFATSRSHSARCASNASQLAKECPAIAFFFT